MSEHSSNILNLNVNPNKRMTLADVEKIPLSLPCLMGWKDRGSHYLGITDYMIKYSGLEPRAELLGKCDHEIRRFEGFSEHFMDCDQFAMKIKPIHLVEKTANSENEVITVNAMKYPIYNSSQDKVIGVFFFGMPIENKVISSQLIHSAAPITISGTHYIFDVAKQRIQLTEQESRVLYYYLRGRTSKQIAHVLCLSYRTVNDYIFSLKNKLHVETRADVIDLVMTLGLFDFIPISILNAQ